MSNELENSSNIYMDAGISEIGSLSKESLSDGVIRVLRQAILSGKLKSGDRLIESEIANHLGVSRAPIREALRAMSEQGLVEMSTHRGSYVTSITAKDAEEIYSLREVLEGFVIELIGQHIKENDIRRLQECLDMMRAHAATGYHAGVVEEDLRFHTILWETSRHKLLKNTLMSMRSQVEMLLVVNAQLYDDLLGGIEDHQPIIDEIRLGAWSKVTELLKTHIRSSGELVIQSLKEWEAGADT